MSATLTAYRLLHRRLPRIVPASADRFWMDFSTGGWANRCMPLRIANQAGWVLLNEADFEVVWSGKPQVSALQIRFAKGQYSPWISSNFGHGIITWEIPYLFRTPPGYNLLARGPANTIKDGVAPLEGLVETDWSTASFTMNWKVTRPFKPIKFQKDEPVCMLVPQKRGELEEFAPEMRNLESDPELEKRYEHWLEARRAWVKEQKNAPLPADGHAPHQGHYARGTTTSGEHAREHQSKLALRQFTEAEPPILDPAKETRPSETVPAGFWPRLKNKLGAG
jgi:uncharacterized protein DUF6065